MICDRFIGYFFLNPAITLTPREFFRLFPIKCGIFTNVENNFQTANYGLEQNRAPARSF